VNGRGHENVPGAVKGGNYIFWGVRKLPKNSRTKTAGKKIASEQSGRRSEEKKRGKKGRRAKSRFTIERGWKKEGQQGALVKR